MLNRVTNILSERAIRRGNSDRPWQVDQNPTLRLTWLFVLISLPVIAIMVRLAHLQIFLTEVYVEAFDVSTTEFEPIASHDGRIISPDGRVLAYDLERFSITMHYRWLEEPPNEAWLKQQALATLKRAERRKPERVEAAKNQLLERRAKLLEDLAQITKGSREKLAESRKRVQDRVERIVARMHENQEERQNDTTTEPGTGPDGSGWFAYCWDTVVTAVTTPPRRESDDLLVAREELDYHMILEDVPLAVRAEIESHPKRYPGLRITPTTSRLYLESSVAPHIIGTRTPLTNEEVAERREKLHGSDPLDYEPGDRIGRTGLERSYDAQIRGLRGLRKITRNRYREVIAEEIVRPPRAGDDVQVTLHMPLQAEIESVLDDVLAGKQQTTTNDSESTEPPALVPDGASIVAIDVHTGAVLVAASAPRFDLGASATPDAVTWKAINADPRRPLFHRAIQMTLPPGSVFKTLTSVAMIESGRLDPDRKVFCQGYLDRPDQHRCYVFSHFGVGHGDTDLSDALCHSCNVYFFEGARKIGPEQIVSWADRFGFGHPTGIDLPGEAGGNVPSPNQKRNTPAGPRKVTWYPGDTLGLAIGQSRLMVTPLQVARMMATVANGGYLVTPQIAMQMPVSGTSRAVLDPIHERRRIADLTDVTLERIREGLERVVSDPGGTGHKAVYMEEITIAGKTGTAEVGGNRPDHAWFAGYVPVDKPRIAFAVVLEHAGSGGKAAGPVAKKFVEALLGHGVLQPTRLVVHEERPRRTNDDEE